MPIVSWPDPVVQSIAGMLSHLSATPDRSVLADFCGARRDSSLSQSRHLIFDNGRVIWIGFSSPRPGKSQSLVEADSGLVIARDHQEQSSDVAPMRPAENLRDQEPAYALLTVCRGRPHGNKVCSRRIVLVEK